MHIVLDDTAMAAAGQGNVLASRLIHRAHAEPGWFLYASACALVEADRARPGTAEHLASVPSITVLDLDLAAALPRTGGQVSRSAYWTSRPERSSNQFGGPRPVRWIGRGPPNWLRCWRRRWPFRSHLQTRDEPARPGRAGHISRTSSCHERNQREHVAVSGEA